MNEEISHLSFAYPALALAGVLLCGCLVWLSRRFERRRETDMAKIVHPRFRQKVFAGYSPQMRRRKRMLWIAACFFLLLAMARPQWGYEFREVSRRGIDILFALDTSQSMLAEDLTPNRLDRARLGIMDFVDRLEGDRIGLIPFAGSAYALCPLTLDYSAFRESLGAVDTNMIPRQGTDIASAISEAERLFTETKNNQRILVLITDGEDLQGDVIEKAKAASKNGMVIYTVGVGSPEGATIPVRTRNGQQQMMRDEAGEVVRTKLDESTLKKIAESAHGIYTPLGRGAEGLEKIYQEKLRLVPKTELNQRMQKIPLERYQWPLGLALFLMLVEFFLPNRRQGRTISQVSALPQLLAIFALCMIMPLHGQSDCRVLYNEGTSAYQQGDFPQAEQSLKSALRTADLSLQQLTYYNLGNTQFRSGQAALEKDPKETIKHWKEAVSSYDAALALNDADADARFNKEIVEKKLKELEQQQPQDSDKKEQDKKDQEKKEEEKKEQEKQEQEKQEQEKKDQDQKDQQDKKDGKKDGKKDEEGKEGDEKKDPSEQKEGEESKEGEKGDQEKDQQQGQQGDKDKDGKEESPQQAQSGEKREMTKEEAMQLLESMRGEERRVMPVPMQRRDGKMDRNTKGKTW